MKLFQKIDNEGKKDNFFLRHKKATIITAVVLIAVLSCSLIFGGKKKAVSGEITTNTAKVERGSLKVEITGSGTVEANEQYDINSIVTGDVLFDYFEEGDVIEKDSVMYQIDAESAQNSITRAQSSLEKAQMNYDNALDDYNNLTVTAPIDGVVTAVNVKKGASVGNNTMMFTITDTSKMLLKINFNANDAKALYEGAVGMVYLDNSADELTGTVKKISTGSFNVNSVEVCQVQILVDNPGTLKEGDTATAIVNSVACNSSGTFEVNDTENVTAQVSGEIEALYADVGDKVVKGQKMAQIKSNSAKNSLKNAQLSYNDASTSLSDAYDNLDNYTITAPITGTVLSKTVKAGDTISAGNGGATAMAIVADMSKLKFTISVDELDISKMEKGQKVVVTADALENQRFEGVIDKVSIVGTTQNGVTTYPVTVIIEEYGDLIPGMNVDASIVVDEARDTLIVPLSAVQRGNIVYVKNEDIKDDQKKQEMPQRQGKENVKRESPYEGYTAVRVETGLSNSDYVEIKSGLYEGQEFIYVQTKSTQTNTFMMGGMPGGMGMPQGGMPQGGMSRPQGSGSMSGGKR